MMSLIYYNLELVHNNLISLIGLERLEILHLGSNKLNNSIFSSTKRLISLKTLTLDRNDLGDIIPMQG